MKLDLCSHVQLRSFFDFFKHPVPVLKHGSAGYDENEATNHKTFCQGLGPNPLALGDNPLGAPAFMNVLACFKGFKVG